MNENIVIDFFPYPLISTSKVAFFVLNSFNGTLGSTFSPFKVLITLSIESSFPLNGT